jgi:regulator of protease activity HflC (stomatin/prohibitin superfamily)
VGYFFTLFAVLLGGGLLYKLFRQAWLASTGSKLEGVLGNVVVPGLMYGTPLVAALLTLNHATVQVPAGHVGLVYSFGSITGQRSEGLQWIAPWHEIRLASIQVQGHSFKDKDSLDSFSKESQIVMVEATINVQVSPKAIQALYRDVGPNYYDILVRPRVLQAFKDEMVKYLSVEIAPNRENIRRAVRERLTKELEVHSIAVQDLLMDDIEFTKSFQEAIEEKQKQSQLTLAEQEKVKGEKAKAEQKVEAAKGEAEAVLVAAEKQAEANRKLSESLSPALLQYQYITRLAPNVSVMMVPGNQPFLLNPDAFRALPAKP